MFRNQKRWAWAAFAAYALGMLWLLFGQRVGHGAGGLNLKVFDTLRRFWWVLAHSSQPEMLRHAVINLVGNVIMFVPLGFFACWLWRKPNQFGWHFLAMLLTILGVELLQLLTGLGTCEVDDLILNLIGTTIGFGLFKLCKHMFCRGGS